MNLRKDFDGFSDEYEVIESLSSGASSKSMYGAADRPSPAPDASYNRVNVFGNVRNIKSFERVEWTFIAIGVISLLTSLGFTVERFIHFHKQFNASESIYQEICNPNDPTNCIERCHHWTCLSDFTFALILIVNLIFAIFYGVDGLIRERGFELLGVLIPIIIVLSYLSSNFVYHLININHGKEANFSHHELIFRIVRLATSWILGPLLAVSTIRVYIKMGKLVFILFEDTKIKRIYQFSSFLSTLLFFNMQLLFNIVILAFSRDVTFLDKTETVALPILVAYTVALSPVGWYGIWYEHTSMMVVFLISLIPTPAYYIYKIVNVALNYHPFYDNHPYKHGSHREDISHYEFIAIFLFIINGLGLLAFVLIVIFAIKVIKNFGKGLKEKIQPPFSMYMCCKRQ